MNKKISFFSSMQYKIALVFILLLLSTIEVIGAYFVHRLEQQNVENFKTQVQLPSWMTAPLSTDLSSNTTKSRRNIRNTVKDFTNVQISEMEVIDNQGRIVATKDDNNQQLVGKRTTNSQIKDAIYSGRKVTQISHSDREGSYYLSITPLINSSGENNTVVGAIYIRADMDQVYKNINRIVFIFFISSLVAGIFGALISIVVARAITRPIAEMKRQANRMANGDYSGQVRVYSNDELGQLAIAVNNLSVKVEEEQENSKSERLRLDSVLGQMTDGVVATDRHGKVIIINEAAQNFLDIDAEQATTMQLDDVLKLDDHVTFNDLLNDQSSQVIGPNIASDGDELTLQVDFSLTKRSTGFVTGLVCVLHDITKQQRIDQDRREFVSNVSHELRTPLTSLHSYIETLNEGAWQDPNIAPQFLKVTQEETERMIRMVNSLLSLSRLDQGTAKMNVELVNFNEMFNYILDRFDLVIQKDEKKAQEEGKPVKHYKIKRIFTRRDLWVEIDPDKMTQAIDNIINNALKYSPDGGLITCRLLDTNHSLILSISDQGLGIPRKDLKHIFDRFYRVDKARSRKQGGTGLGLAIAKEVIEAQGGHMWVKSAENHGSTFYISLPYDPMENGGYWDEKF
ncbi:cell wall metabolism sensor histidine kinase WalK [Bombilactobacillus thymidiniphilus]|uniref:histidine kinase n=1 Tax=Bombilactobacillus thymidiniphilus TaxID=2923363 RepID=A0ABY4PF72_9LACO|nr:cell wall metabolism sensor histidine kinase WalK [Bombilactobacillus thymidiniphilus]UQS84295.1 cell wall metabolism sensor histidine kinase WalK [Bombilactobacillus thymidiniphilus]